MQDIALAAIRYYQKLVPLATALFADVDLLAHFRLWMQEHQYLGQQEACQVPASPLNGHEPIFEEKSSCVHPRIVPSGDWLPKLSIPGRRYADLSLEGFTKGHS